MTTPRSIVCTLLGLALAGTTTSAHAHSPASAAQAAVCVVIAEQPSRADDGVFIRVVRCIDDNGPLYHTNVHNYRNHLLPLNQSDVAILKDADFNVLHATPGVRGNPGINTPSAYANSGVQACLETSRYSGGRKQICTGVAG
ncbi:hypothetical protein [Streptomyces lomondensis]|uniref:Secreted protein n=1 Tax=Streptomyces lomondensis TaxID=68229 RepID=A0ABQ2XR49_9ACTN|nr:hypothetical protein [Streptomyces lomondensis]MCF0080830.1 hypothetical protein [Streptomyces lomondensis]GGX29190.1 hypothetical protein GCM10010383_69750 [Streptomyces lomondensis]